MWFSIEITLGHWQHYLSIYISLVPLVSPPPWSPMYGVPIVYSSYADGTSVDIGALGLVTYRVSFVGFFFFFLAWSFPLFLPPVSSRVSQPSNHPSYCVSRPTLCVRWWNIDTLRRFLSLVPTVSWCRHPILKKKRWRRNGKSLGGPSGRGLRISLLWVSLTWFFLDLLYSPSVLDDRSIPLSSSRKSRKSYLWES